MRKEYVLIVITGLIVLGIGYYAIQKDLSNSVGNGSPLAALENAFPSGDQKEPTTSTALQMPKNNYLISARTGIFKGYLDKKVLGRDEVRGYLEEGETISCDVFVITEGDMSMFYHWTRDGDMVTLSKVDLPYEIYIGNGDIRALPELTQEVLRESSPSAQVYAAITEYVNTVGKDRDTCETTIEYFIAFHPT